MPEVVEREAEALAMFIASGAGIPATRDISWRNTVTSELGATYHSLTGESVVAGELRKGRTL